MTAIILDGTVLGLQFGLLAVGLTLVYGLGGVLNLAYGQMAVVAAITSSLAMDAGLPAVLAVVVGLLVGGVSGLLLDATLLRPVYRRSGEARVLLSLLLTLGLAFIIDGLLLWRFPLEALTLHIGGGPVEILGVPMRRGSLLASAISVVVFVGLFLFFRSTMLGRAVRSIIENEEGARLVGIDPKRMTTFILATSGLLAALVAVTRSMSIPVTVTSGVSLSIFALIVAVVGGLGSVAGAFLAGLILGIVSTFSAFYIGTFLTFIILLAAAGLTILLRPSGLLGVPE
ncbi:MAG: branched-chain amino acid ABC transporter permease [Acidimicrobiia bacterium]|jgi:branched-chain amino acid transport system permease protein